MALGSLFICLLMSQIVQGQFSGFSLTASKTNVRPGDDVIFRCQQTPTDRLDPRSRVFPDDKKILWKRKGVPTVSTQADNGQCHVRLENGLAVGLLTDGDIKDITCEQEDTWTVSLFIPNITVAPDGDSWACSKFPFLESNVVLLNNFVAVTDVTLTVIDHFPDSDSPELLMTLQCRTSPSSPEPSVVWRFLSKGGKPLALPGQSRKQSRTEGSGRLTVISELAVPPDPRYEDTVVKCEAANEKDRNVSSREITLTVKRAPRITGLFAVPSNEVVEGTDVTLACDARGYPAPRVLWRKRDGFLPGGLLETSDRTWTTQRAKIEDSGEFTCTAFNGVPHNASNSIFLKVKEPLTTLTATSATTVVTKQAVLAGEVAVTPGEAVQQAGVRDKLTTIDSNSSAQGGSDAGAVAGGVVGSLIIVAVVALAVMWFLYKKRKKNSMSSSRSSNTLFPADPNRSLSTPRSGVYTTKSSLRPTIVHPTLSAGVSSDQYQGLPPAPSPPGAITNRGYGLSMKLNGIPSSNGRPLPAAPSTYDESRYTCDSGYDEIRDVERKLSLTVSLDGYEVPQVLEEDDEEESIYDVAQLVQPSTSSSETDITNVCNNDLSCHTPL